MDERELEDVLKRAGTCRRAELPALWATYMKGPCPRNPVMARYSLAWHLQAQQYGGHSAETRRRLRELLTAYAKDPNFTPAAAQPMKPGAEYQRVWKGSLHRVQVTNEGFEYEGQLYKSLSAIARKITGAICSGPKFFGAVKQGQTRATA